MQSGVLLDVLGFPSRPISTPPHPRHPQAKLPVGAPRDGSWVIDSNWDEKQAAAKCDFASTPLAVLFEGTDVFNHAQKILDLSLNDRQQHAAASEPSNAASKSDAAAGSVSGAPEGSPGGSQARPSSSASSKKRRTAFTPTPSKKAGGARAT